jgi:hypothetical protein
MSENFGVLEVCKFRVKNYGIVWITLFFSLFSWLLGLLLVAGHYEWWLSCPFFGHENFIYQDMSWLNVARGPSLNSRNVYLKKICAAFLEIVAHSANFLWLSQDIDCFQDIFDTFYIKFCTLMTGNKSAKRFSPIL